MKSVINIQSISDIITNSSTEIYTVATDNTIKSVKNLINAILKLGGNNNITFDDLFTVKLSYNSDVGFDPSDLIVKLPLDLGKLFAKDLKYFEDYTKNAKTSVTKDEYYKKIDDFMDRFVNNVPDPTYYLRWINEGSAFDIGLCIEAKDKNNKIAQDVAKSLSGLGIINDYEQSAVYS